MKEFFRHPERNALILGLAQGIPQGLAFSDQKQFLGAGFDTNNLAFFLFFGLIMPPVLIAFSHFANRRRSRSLWEQKIASLWEKLCTYLNPHHMVSWGCLSIGVLGAYSLHVTNASEGYAICAFFISGAFGFAAAHLLEKKLKQQR